MKRLDVGDKPKRGTIVTLYRGLGDSRQTREYFESVGEWICPATVNDFWYGAESPEEVAAEIAQYL